MATLTSLPKSNESASGRELQRLPLLNQSVSHGGLQPQALPDRLNFASRKIPPTHWQNITSTLSYIKYSLLRNLSGTSEAVLSSDEALREIIQAKHIWAEKETSTFYTFEALIQFLHSIYTFRDPRAVLRFLEENKFLLPLLKDAYWEIRKYFPDSQIFLEIDTDPENKNDQQLMAFIATNLSPKVALQKLKQFDEDWWLDALDRAQRKLCINVEFE